MPIDWSAMAAITGMATAIVAVLALILQSRQTQLTLMDDFLWRLEERFNSQLMINKRQKAAAHLLNFLDNPETLPDENYDLNSVLDFFESLGYYTRRGVIDKDMAWNHFSYWIIPHWQVSKAYIYQQRKWDPTVWHSFEKLAEELIHIDARRKHRSLTDVTPSESDIREFLEWEAAERKLVESSDR
jgi:hypothetical protein